MKALTALGLLSFVACSGAPSREPMGAEGAALNVGLGVAAAPLHRAATGCFTPCAYGTTCDEKNGVCVSQEEPAKPVASGLPGEGAPAGSASAGPAVAAAPSSAPPPTGVAPLCSPACPVDHTCEMEAGRSICKRR